jgi:hypothetical protein
MKRKIVVLAILLGAAVSSGGYAIGFGAQFNGNFEPGEADLFVPGWALALSQNKSVHYTVYWDISSETNVIGLTGDFWLLNPKLFSFGDIGSLNFFLGPGFYAAVAFNDFDGIPDDEKVDFKLGIRAPIGLNLLLTKDFFEIYLQVVPSWGIGFVPELRWTDFSIPLAAGFRFWFGR